MSVELSIVMPCLNEAETLEGCIVKAHGFLERSGVSGEIVIGDNGSTDGSQDIALRCGARVVDIKIRGYGAAIYGAVMQSRGKYCIMGDADDSYDFSKLEGFVAQLRNGADLVMGNRFLGGIKPGAMPWKNRHIGNPVLSGIGRLFFHAPARDFHCGLRGFSRDAFLRMDLRTTGMEFASEMVIKSTLLNMNIIEVPTTLSKDGRSRPPHLRPFRDGWRHLRFMLLFSPNWIFLYPGLLLMTFGFIIGGALIVSPLSFYDVHFNIGTLIYCVTMIDVGFQAVIFAVLSRAYAMQEGLFPQSSSMSKIADLFSFEKGIIGGSCLLIFGFSLMGYAFYVWSNKMFGELDFNMIIRIIIGSSLALSIGSEVLLSTFLLSILRLAVRINTE